MPQLVHIRRFVPLVLTLALGAACSSPPSNAERFCGEVSANQQQLFAPAVATQIDVLDTVELYRSVSEVTPLAIEPEWQQLVNNYETASTVVASDDTSVQRAVQTALESESAAVTVADWIKTNCGIDVGPVGTLVARD